MSSIVIIAPHQDDEILSCTYVIKRAIKEGKKVLIVFITNGDYDGRINSNIRSVESMTALKTIGVKKSNIFFWGYGDGTIYDLFYSSENEIISSKYSQYTYPPNSIKTYHYIKHGNEAPYTKKSILKDMLEFFMEFMPEEIYCPNILDVHGDHKGTYLFIKVALQMLEKNYKPNVYTYLIHIVKKAAYWPNRIGKKVKKPLGIKISKDLWKQRVIVKENKGIAYKRNLISLFKSQKPYSSYGFLYAFAKEEEIFFKEEI